MIHQPRTSTVIARARAVTIRTIDGRETASTVHVPKGAGALGIAWSDVDAKYRTLVPNAGLSEAAIEASLTMIHDIRRLGI